MANLTVMIVDDHDIFRDGLVSLIAQKYDNITVYEAQNGKVFIDKIINTKPDIVLLDINMPVMNGVEAAKKALLMYPDLKIIVLSMFGDKDYYFKMVELGIKGFLLKNADKTELELAVANVLKGGHYFSSELLESIINDVSKHKNNKQTGLLQQLTNRELSIITLMSHGLSTADIADKLFLSKKTIEGHRSKLLEKTNTKNSIDLVVYAIKNNIVSV